MFHHLKVYIMLLKLNFSRLLAYRSNFFYSLLVSLLWGGFSVITILTLTHRVKSFFGWTQYELIALTLGYNFFIGIFHGLFSRNFDEFSYHVDYGLLASLLLKPLDAQFLISLQYIGYANFIRSGIAGVATYVFLTNYLNLTLTFGQILFFLTIIFVALIMIYSLWLAVSTLMIWSPRLSNLVDMMYSVSSLGRFPKELVLETPYTFFLVFFPLTLIISVPMKVLLHRPLGWDLALLIFFTTGLFLFSRWFWRFALKSYTSASG